MARVVAFPADRLQQFQGSKPYTSLKEAAKLSGIPVRSLTRLLQRGFFEATSLDGEIYLNFEDMLKLRRLRNLPRNNLSRIEQELQGQLDLWATPDIVPLRATPFFRALLAFAERSPEARSLLEAAVAAGDYPADALVNLGILAFEEGDRRRAFEAFSRALVQDPRHAEAQYNLGNLYFYNEELDLSRLHYELARDLAPHFCDVAFNLGLVLALQGEYCAAREEFLHFTRLGGESDVLPELIAALDQALEQELRSKESVHKA